MQAGYFAVTSIFLENTILLYICDGPILVHIKRVTFCLFLIGQF